jgi:predicted nucleotidyltransferase
MVWSQDAILARVENQFQERVQMKYSWRKKVKGTFLRIYRTLCYKVFGQQVDYGESRRGSIDLGVDRFGRNVAEGMQAYVGLLKNRGIHIHSVVVLGSRAKGRWTPDSDVDVTVIASNVLDKDGFLGIRRWFLLSDKPLFMGIESYCCSKEEFLRLLSNFDLMSLDAIYYGKVIYDDGSWVELKKMFEEMERKYDLKKLPLKEMLYLA